MEKTEIFNEQKNKSEELLEIMVDQCQEAKAGDAMKKNPRAGGVKGSTQMTEETKQQYGEWESQSSHLWCWGNAS